MKNLFNRFILVAFLLTCSFPGISQTQIAESLMLNTAQTGTKEYIARNNITLNPGFSYTPSPGNKFIARIDPMLLLPPELNYPDIPDATSSEPETVGSIAGALNVSAGGAAVYSIPIEVPQGVGGMQPTLAIVYNSQSGNGMAGWGCNLSGISAITRAPKDIYHDGTAKALTYLADDAYYLDGQRLIHSLEESAVYYPESDPFTKITVHGTYTATTANTWFEVQASNGMKYYYGSTASGRQSYTVTRFLLSNSPRILAWYLDYVEDPLGNYMNYTYNNVNYCIYPNTIAYGNNKNETDSTHTVTFGYEPRTDTVHFNVEGSIKGFMSNRLKTITTKTGSSTYRTYELQYNTRSDGSGINYSRLTAITEKNGAGEALKPITLDWSYLPAFSQTVTQPTVSAVPLPANTTIKADAKPEYIAGDLNGDGLTDLVWIAPVTTSYTDVYTNYAYVYYASLNDSGIPQFTNPNLYTLGPYFKDRDWIQYKASSSIIDFDGNGINEFIAPHIKSHDSRILEVNFYLRSNTLNTIYDYSLKSSSEEIPVYGAADMNNDGKGEIVLMEKGQNSGKYPCGIRGFNPETTSHLDIADLNLTIPSKPEKMFLSDFNGDGLCDMLIFYSGGYTIFWNQGNGISNMTFSDDTAHKISGTNIGNVWRIWSGDFNGDGLMDFLMSASNDSNWYFALNNGDGTFNKQLACSLGVYDQSFTDRDDPNFDCNIYDFDFDGKSDVVITKAMYEDGILGISDKFVKTYTYWMRSTGSSLVPVPVSPATSFREADAGSATYVLGDFNGDGQPELINYGYNCYNSIDANADPVWRMYRNNNFTVNKGKITSIIGGFGNSTAVTYASLVTGGIYTKGSGSSYPMADYALPLHVVKTVTENNGAAGNLITNYEYGGLKAHLQGKGLLGFSSVKANNTTLGTTTESGVKSWNTAFYIPAETYTKTTIDGKIAETNVTMTIVDKGATKYFAYPSTQTDKDLDGNTVTTTRAFNTLYGYLNEEKADFGNNMYKMYKTVQDSDFILAGGAYRPQMITRIQKHADDANTFTQKTKITYDVEKGYKKQVIENYGSSLPLTTDYTYDTFGNVKTSKVSGSGISPITRNYDYDATKRFVVKTYTTPASLVNTFTHDTWGNVLTENDETNPAYILTTTHKYDNWGNRTSTLLPDGSKTTFQTGWNNNAAKRYFTLTQGTGKPWVKTWYDNRGREVLVETIGAKSMKIQTATIYTPKGQVQQKTATTGNIATTETYSYDGRGRVLTYTHSAGQSISYKYGNRIDTTLTNGRTYTKKYDAWGGILSAIDPQDSVKYTYYSLGKPKTVTTGGAVFSMDYYDTGTQKTLKDPNAGTTTYEYDAAARLIKQTDGRGKITNNVYDAFGRIDTVKTDGIVTKYTYGTSGNEIQRLTRVQTGNDSVAYTHDQLGRITNETRQIDGSETLSFTYAYNSIGQLSITAYPNNVYVYNTYDAYGNLQKLSAGSQTVWELTGETGTVTTEQSGGTLTSTTTRSPQGLLTNLQMTKPGGTIYSTSYVFDGATGNLKSRGSESFLYDNLDRLTTVQTNGSVTQSIGYQANGNIDTKTGLGKYSYSEPLHVHAVTSVENTGKLVSTENQTIDYTGFNKVSDISETVGTDNYRLDFVYGPDQQRWKTTLKKNNSVEKTIIFASDYEKITEGGVTQELYYVGDKAIYVKQAGQPDKIYYAVKDHLGSIVKLVDNNGIAVFEASYDPWGKQTVTNNTFKFHRGFTGHEHLPEFGLINMNGRLYDPVLGRFLSPDPFVQAPDFSQNFNRYSYCLNNPLKYTDPDGEWFWLALGLFSVFTDAGYQAQKAISPIAFHIDLRLRPDQIGIGIDASVGMPQASGLSYRVHGGATYFWKNVDLMGNDLSGWETRYGSEWNIGYYWADQSVGLSYSGTTFNSKWSGKQTTNLMSLGSPDYNIRYENDMEPMGPFKYIPFVPQGDGDRYRTAAVQINLGGWGIGTNLITGDAGKNRWEIGNWDVINEKKTYIAHDGYDPDTYRMGLFYFRVGPFRFGKNSENTRKIFQNQFAHDFLTGGGSYWFKVLPLKSRWYWGFGYSGGGTLW